MHWRCAHVSAAPFAWYRISPTPTAGRDRGAPSPPLTRFYVVLDSLVSLEDEDWGNNYILSWRKGKTITFPMMYTWLPIPSSDAPLFASLYEEKILHIVAGLSFFLFFFFFFSFNILAYPFTSEVIFFLFRSLVKKNLLFHARVISIRLCLSELSFKYLDAYTDTLLYFRNLGLNGTLSAFPIIVEIEAEEQLFVALCFISTCIGVPLISTELIYATYILNAVFTFQPTQDRLGALGRRNDRYLAWDREPQPVHLLWILRFFVWIDLASILIPHVLVFVSVVESELK